MTVDRGRGLAACAVAAAAATAVYLLHAGRSYTFDESVSVARFISTGSPRVALTEQYVFNNHPLFSSLQALLWRAGGDTETWQRIPPVVYGVGAAAVLGGAVWRRLGVVPGATAAALLITNPMFAEQARLVRGYSFATCAVVVAGVALHERVTGGSWRALAVHGVGIVVAMGTHLYAGVAFAGMGVMVVTWWLAARRRPDRALLATWVGATALSALVYLPTIGYLRDVSEARGQRWDPTFAADAARSLLGGNAIAIAAWATLCVAGLLALARQRTVLVAALAGIAAALGLCGLVWLVVQPFDLYPRFLVVLLPGVGLAAAIAVARWPRLVVVAMVGVAAMSVGAAADWYDEAPNRQSAEVLVAARAAGLRPCVLGGAGLAAYERDLPEVITPRDLAGCDVFIRAGSWGGPEIDEATRDRFEHRWCIGGRRGFSTVPPTAFGLDRVEVCPDG